MVGLTWEASTTGLRSNLAKAQFNQSGAYSRATMLSSVGSPTPQG